MWTYSDLNQAFLVHHELHALPRAALDDSARLNERQRAAYVLCEWVALQSFLRASRDDGWEVHDVHVRLRLRAISELGLAVYDGHATTSALLAADHRRDPRRVYVEVVYGNHIAFAQIMQATLYNPLTMDVSVTWVRLVHPFEIRAETGERTVRTRHSCSFAIALEYSWGPTAPMGRVWWALHDVLH